MRFTHPVALILLLLLPLVAFLGWSARGSGRKRELAALSLRLVIVLALVLALAGFEAVRPADQLSVVYLLDASASMPPQARSAAEDWIRQSLTAMGPDDQAGVVVFGQDALVERSLSTARTLGTVASVPDPGGTDLAAAIRLGLALYPPATARRMVILSDGAVNREGSFDAARLAQASGVQIQAVPLNYNRGPEILVASVEAPSHLRTQEQFDLWVTVQANQPGEAAIRVFANDALVFETQQSFRLGKQTLSLPLKANEPGFTQYRVQIDPLQDTQPQNNALSAFSIVEGPPQILVVSAQGETAGEAAQLEAALQSSGLNLQPANPGALPSQAGGLSQYAAVVLVDLPASELSLRQMEALQSYARDLGGGLVVVGGPASYGVGGYFRTPLEETLPVEMQIKDEQRRPVVTIVFVIDHSGSMADTSGGAVKLELAKEAALRSTELLFPNDRVGVVAFDETAGWIVPITSLEDPQSVKNAIGSLRPGGGTDILAGLQAVESVLPQDPGKVKHVILLTDGGADPSGLSELVARMHAESGITLSTVGVGQDAAPFLADLAQTGGGRYHFTADASAIPTIFTSETSLATRAYIEEHPFYPQLSSPSPVLSGINQVPQLLGYIATTPKSSAQTVLVSDLGDPILSTWQYGLGRAAAFTSDATGRWAKSWTGWEDFPRFWAQLVGDVARREEQDQSISIRVEGSGAGSQAVTARLTVDARGTGGEFRNGYQFSARVVSPGGQVQTALLAQTAPGHYEGEFDSSQPGAYSIAVSGQPSPDSAGTNSSLASITGWVNPYPAEYSLEPPNPQLLDQVSQLTGGGVAALDPAEVFQHNLPAPHTTRPLWTWMLALAALLLPVEIGLRRLSFSKEEVHRAGMWLAERLKPVPVLPAPAPERTPRLQALLKAKQQPHRELPPVNVQEESPPINQQDQAANPENDPGSLSRALGSSDQNREDRIESSGPSTAARLLAKKRAGRDRDRP